MPTRSPPPISQGVQDREVLARLENLAGGLAAVAADAREARDGVLRINATLAEQNVGERLQALHDEIKAQDVSQRADLVNASGHIRRELAAKVEALELVDKDQEARIDVLEKARDEAMARSGMFKWLADHAPWILAAAAAIMAALGLGEHHH